MNNFFLYVTILNSITIDLTDHKT